MRLVGICFWIWLCGASGLALAQSPELQQLWRQAIAEQSRGQHTQALPIAEQAVRLAETQAGLQHPNTAFGLLLLARSLRELGRLAEAQVPAERAVAIYEAALPPNDPNIATALNNLAFLFEKQARYADAERLYSRSLAIREAANGPDHPAVANILNNLAALHRLQGRLAEAEKGLLRSLAILERAQGPDSLEVAATANNLAEVYRADGAPAKAAPLYERALEAWRKRLGATHATLAVPLNNLAELRREEGRYGEAENLYRQSLAIRERAHGLEHPEVALGLNNLAALYRAQGRFHDAESLYLRALAIREKALGDKHPDVARTLNNLARVYRSLRRYGEAEEMFLRAQAIWEAALGPNHPDLAFSLDNLARMYRLTGRLAESAPLFHRSLRIWEVAYGPEHPAVARALLHMGELSRANGEPAAAEVLYSRSAGIYERIFGPEHPLVADALYRLAELKDAGAGADAALALARRATAIMRARTVELETERSDSTLAEQRAMRENFMVHLAALHRAATHAKDAAARRNLIDESIEVAQLALASSTARAVARMSARFAAGGDRLASLVRERQDLAETAKRIDAELLKAASEAAASRDREIEARARARLVKIEGDMTSLDERLALEFPRYAEIANPRAPRTSEIQALLKPDEALIQYLVGDEFSFAWVVTARRIGFHRLEAGREALTAAVMWLREGLDPSLALREAGRIAAFDLAMSHAVYGRIFAPIAKDLAGAEHLLFVPDGPLASLPPAVLVLEPPPPIGARDRYRRTKWLGWSYATSILPAISSLTALRGAALAAPAAAPFLGIGEPKMPAAAAGPEPGHFPALRRLAELPDTARELGQIATALGADSRSVLLREQASEANVRAGELSQYRILAFATHGLIAGDLLGLSEPALVLSPGVPAPPENDGVLTASEIAGLKLNADWVVLSACNTAASDGTPGADGLSGLAKAFFFAGSRALLVSHWPVDSEAAVRLTTRTFQAMAAAPKLARASALRRAMTELARDPKTDRFAHPLFWAPFVVVGEGGPAR
jgi:CHAT domain-containing protein